MTNKTLIHSLLFILILCDGCKDEPINITCADPLGSESRTLNINELSCFLIDYKGCFQFRISSGSVIIQSIYVDDITDAPQIYDAGVTNCLSGVVERPSSGWKYVVPAQERHGYIFKMKDGTLGRLFIDSWKTSGGTVVSLNITRQYSY